MSSADSPAKRYGEIIDAAVTDGVMITLRTHSSTTNKLYLYRVKDTELLSSITIDIFSRYIGICGDTVFVLVECNTGLFSYILRYTIANDKSLEVILERPLEVLPNTRIFSRKNRLYTHNTEYLCNKEIRISEHLYASSGMVTTTPYCIAYDGPILNGVATLDVYGSMVAVVIIDSDNMSLLIYDINDKSSRCTTTNMDTTPYMELSISIIPKGVVITGIRANHNIISMVRKYECCDDLVDNMRYDNGVDSDVEVLTNTKVVTTRIDDWLLYLFTAHNPKRTSVQHRVITAGFSYDTLDNIMFSHDD